MIVQDSQQLTNKKALMQEAAMIRAMGIQNLTNIKNERFSEKSWKMEVKFGDNHYRGQIFTRGQSDYRGQIIRPR